VTLVEGQPVPAPLADAPLLTATGEAARLRDTWKRNDALILFLRHFACVGCSDHVSELRPRLAELVELRVRVTLIGCGTPAQLTDFVERHELGPHPLTIYTDPTLSVYKEVGLARSLWSTAGPRAAINFLRLLARGHRNGVPQGDVLQQGGTLLVDRGGTVRYCHRSRFIGDHVPLVELMDQVMRRRAAEVPR
jgi:peroxiredoxin